MKDLILGMHYVLRGIKLINTPGLRRFFLVPLLINILVFAVLIWLGIGQFGALMEWLLPAGNSWWEAMARVALWLLFAVAALVILFFTFSLIANLIGSPFNGLLAEKVEEQLRGKLEPEPGGLRKAVSEIPQSLVNELRKFVYYLIFALVILMLTFIPLVNVASPILWMAFGSWMLALEYLSYPMENHNMKFKRVRQRLSEKKMISFGFGLAVMLGTMIPIVNFIIMPAAVAGAAALWVDQWSVNRT